MMTMEDAVQKLLTYKVGDLVCSRAMFEQWLASTVDRGRRFTVEAPSITPMVILERSLVECHGGVQAFFSVRQWRDGAEVSRLQFVALELVTWDFVVKSLDAKAEADKTKGEFVPKYWRDALDSVMGAAGVMGAMATLTEP